MLKSLTPVRMLRNPFFDHVKDAEALGESADKLRALLGKGRAKAGMFEGNIDEGQLEIGQISAMIQQIEPVEKVMKRLIQEYRENQHPNADRNLVISHKEIQNSEF